MRGRAAFVYHVSSVDTIGSIPSECGRHAISSSGGPDTRRQSQVFHTPRGFNAAVNFNSFE